jgi:F-type H+-transporting ATPase subunit b
MNCKGARFSFIAASLFLAGSLLLPETVFASEEGNAWGIWFDLGRVFNLLIVVGVLVWIARKPLSNFFANRSQSIREELAEAQKARLEAESKLAEIEARMSRLDDELKDIAGASEKEGQEEYQRLVAAAEQDAQKIVERSRQEIEGMTRAAQLELKQHAAELSVQMAEERIRHEFTPADRERLFSRFVTKLGGPS